VNHMVMHTNECLDMESITEGMLLAIRRIIQASDLHSNSIKRSSGLTSPQLLLLRAIASHPEASIGQLSNKICLSQSTVTIIMDHLEKQGLAIRERCKLDRRKVYARLTETGQLALEVAPLPLQVHFIERFEGLLEHERSALLSALQQVASMMDEPGRRMSNSS